MHPRMEAGKYIDWLGRFTRMYATDERMHGHTGHTLEEETGRCQLSIVVLYPCMMHHRTAKTSSIQAIPGIYIPIVFLLVQRVVVTLTMMAAKLLVEAGVKVEKNIQWPEQ